MSRSSLVRLASLAVLVPPLAVSPAPAPAVAQDAAARLVPADASVVVRLESVEAWNALARAFEPIAGDGSLASHDLAALIAAFQDPAVEQGELDRTRPIYLAASFTGGMPLQTVVVPITGSTPIVPSPELMTGVAQTLVLDGWCGISTVPGYAAGAEPSRLLEELADGVVSLRVDLAGLIATFRPLIEMGLDQAEMALDQLGQVESPIDVQVLMEAYLDMARDVIDSAVALDVALARQASELALTFAYTGRDAAPEADVLPDVTALAARLDPASAGQIVYNGRVTDALDVFGDFAEAAVDAYPEPLRTDMARMLDMTYELGALLEPGIAMDFDFGPDGMSGRYVLCTTRPAEVVELVERSLLAFEHDGGLMRFGPAETRTLGGLEVRVLPFELQYEALLALAAETDPGAEVETVPTEELEEIFAQLYGRDLRFALAPMSETVTLAVAGSEPALEALLTAGAGQVPDVVARNLARIPPGAQGFVYSVDFGRLMSRMSAAMQALVPGTPVPELPATFDTWGSRQGATWTFGMAMDVAEFVAFVQALQELEPEEPEEPDEPEAEDR